MITIGINDGHDAGVALLKDGRIIYASNEERFSRRKMHSGFPYRSLENALSETGVSINQIDEVAFGGYGPIFVPLDCDFDQLNRRSLLRKAYAIAAKTGLIKMDGVVIPTLHRKFAKLQRFMPTRQGSMIRCRKIGLTGQFLHMDHHACHAASAYFTSPFSKATIFTLDGGGDGLSGSLWRGENGHLVRLSEVPKIHSAGNFWDYITYICGFSPTRHGGKITGLAAYEPCVESYQILKKYFSYKPEVPCWNNKACLFWDDAVRILKKELTLFSKEQIAWGAQKVLEENCVGIVREGVKRTGIPYVAAAGGVFANVRLNQILLEIPKVEDIFIHPHMGDGGLALGAAYLSQSYQIEIQPALMRHAYLGPDVDAETIYKIAKRMNVVAISLEDPELFVAKLLAKRKVVGLFRGRMEYGPRALCNRSILAEPTDVTMQDWLNDRLGRTEFMPFAPVIMEENAAEYFDEYPKASNAARFMTLCYNATKLCKQNAPGVVHVDGTSRPQVADAVQNSFIHNVLCHYKTLTGLPLCVNTSFNRHEEPIVNTPEEAITELLAGRIDALVIDKYYISSDMVQDCRAQSLA